MSDDDFVRPDYRIEVIYKKFDGTGYFVSPDGIGRYFYDTLAEARDQWGDLPVIRATKFETEYY